MQLKRIYILYILLFLFCFQTKCQPVPITSYSFLNTKADTLVLFSQSEKQFQQLSKKFSKMIQTGKGQVKILHIGDSHLQADLYTGQARKNFQSFLSGLEGSRGMITPFVKGSPDSYKINFSSDWHSVNILSHSDNANLGLWGTTAYTTSLSSTINLSVNNKNYIKYDFNRMRIYHSELKEEDNIVISDIETAYQKIRNKDKGYTEFVFADYLTDIKITVTKTDNSTFYLYGFYFDNADAGVVYNVTGTNGASALSYLNAERFTSELSAMDFDLIIVSLGTNDTYEPGGENTFEDNLTNLVNRIKNVQTNIPILLISSVECWHHKRRINPRQERTVEIIRNTAQKTGCAYLDMYSVLGGKNSSNKLFQNSLMQSDKVHLTAKGYKLKGDLLYNALWNAIEKNF